MKHEPARILFQSRFPRQGGRGQRKWNVWYYRFSCPVCGREFVRLANPMRGRIALCTGLARLTVTKKPQGEAP